MHNPFESIEAQLSAIAESIIDLREAFRKQFGEDSVSQSQIGRTMNMREASKFLELTRQTLYRKTSKNEIPHYKRAGRVFFDRQELEDWLLGKRVQTK